jgi:hypothetical protein
MRKGSRTVLPALCALFFLVLFFALAYAQPSGPVQLKYGKMGAVSFSHKTHVDKLSLDCKICHHKDADNPGKCTSCHPVQVGKGGAPEAREVFHKVCRDCHNKQAEKGMKAPTKCLECHRK